MLRTSTTNCHLLPAVSVLPPGSTTRRAGSNLPTTLSVAYGCLQLTEDNRLGIVWGLFPSTRSPAIALSLDNRGRPFVRHPANPAEDATDESYRLTFGRFGSLSPRTPQSVAITNSHLSKELRVSADGWLVSESKLRQAPSGSVALCHASSSSTAWEVRLLSNYFPSQPRVPF